MTWVQAQYDLEAKALALAQERMETAKVEYELAELTLDAIKTRIYRRKFKAFGLNRGKTISIKINGGVRQAQVIEPYDTNNFGAYLITRAGKVGKTYSCIQYSTIVK